MKVSFAHKEERRDIPGMGSMWVRKRKIVPGRNLLVVSKRQIVSLELTQLDSKVIFAPEEKVLLVQASSDINVVESRSRNAKSRYVAARNSSKVGLPLLNAPEARKGD
jgi:hypothetical protein